MEGLRAGEVLLYARRTAPGDRRAAWRLLEEALAQRLGLAGLPPAAREERGRPYFPGLPGVRFSLSHSGPFCLCALAAGPVGADVEAVRPRGEVLLRRGLTEAERAWCLEEADPWPRFCLLWTRRESLGKYTGRGLALPVREKIARAKMIPEEQAAAYLAAAQAQLQEEIHALIEQEGEEHD